IAPVPPGRRQMPVVKAFPAQCLARTPEALERELWGLTYYHLVRGAEVADVEDTPAAWQLNRPLQGRAGWSFELEDGLLRNKMCCLWSRWIINGLRLVVKASIGP